MYVSPRIPTKGETALRPAYDGINRTSWRRGGSVSPGGGSPGYALRRSQALRPAGVAQPLTAVSTRWVAYDAGVRPLRRRWPFSTQPWDRRISDAAAAPQSVPG